jgi:hypothetical protein
MLISELNFSHLRAEHEAWLTRELEQRRVVEERRAEARPTTEPERRGRRSPSVPRVSRMLRALPMPRRSRGPVDPCPTCPSPA